jgi:hypothetical protein
MLTVPNQPIIRFVKMLVEQTQRANASKLCMRDEYGARVTTLHTIQPQFAAHRAKLAGDQRARKRDDNVLARSRLFDGNADHASAHHPERACRTHGDIDDAAAHERPAIVDDTLDGTSRTRSHRDNASHR